MKIEKGQLVISMLSAPNNEVESKSIEDQSVFLATKNGYGKRTPLEEFTRHGRGTKGMISIQTSARNGVAIGASLVNETDEIMLISDNGVLVRTRVCEVREMGRATQGVRLINLDSLQSLVGFHKISEDDIEVED